MRARLLWNGFALGRWILALCTGSGLQAPGQPFHFRITRVSELTQEPPRTDEPPPGSIRNVVIRNVLARAKGTSIIRGHPESWLDGISFENVRLVLSSDPAAPFDVAEHALHFRWARNLKLDGVEVSWEKPDLATWKSALHPVRVGAAGDCQRTCAVYDGRVSLAGYWRTA